MGGTQLGHQDWPGQEAGIHPLPPHTPGSTSSARLHPPRLHPLTGRPHVPLGDGVLNSQQALDWVDVLVHSELLGSDNRLPPMYRSLH